MQTFMLVRRPSPWRIGLFAGPNFAYCGTWDNTFGSNFRDRTLYNGTGFNLTGNVDYLLSQSTRRLRFGLGTAFGYQNYWTRRQYRDELTAQAVQAGIPANQLVFKNRPSEDMFLTVGPMLSWVFARSRRNPSCVSFLEFAIRGGLFRTEAATIAAYVPSQNNRLFRYVNISDRLYHFGGLGSLGVYFPLRNNWHLGVQGQAFYTGLNYLIVNPDNNNPNSLLEYFRRHGGFNVGLGVRKGFVQKKLIPTAPVVCPTCDSIPELQVSLNNVSLAGRTLRQDSLQQNILPVISWRSTTVNPRNETFTARLHYKSDSLAGTPDRIIAESVNTTGTTLAFPTNHVDATGLPLRGFYYVTVHSRQEAKCGACMSEVATTSFALLAPQGCEYRHNYDQLTFKFHLTYDDTFTVFCNCPGQERQPIGTVRGRRRFYNWNSLGLDGLTGSSTTNTITVQLGDTLDYVTTDPTARLTDAAYSAVRATRDELARRIEQAAQNNPALRGKRPRVVFDEIRGSYSIEQTRPCNGETTVAPAQRYNFYYFNRTNDYTLDYLGTNTMTVPAPQLLPQTQLQRRATPQRRTTTPRRRR
ncbi:hypothetical protein [Nibrella viscosa]